jgi:hypothetical protein
MKDSCFAAFFSRPFPLGAAPNDVEIAIITEPLQALWSVVAALIVHLPQLRAETKISRRIFQGSPWQSKERTGMRSMH